jgi:SAM-dependent methyltransferase
MSDKWAKRQEDEDMKLHLQSLLNNAENDGDPLRWFEDLYDSANGDSSQIPWARMEVNPILKDELEREYLEPGRALMVGCGLGDDAIYLEELGWDVVAFDLSPSCISWCKERFASSSVIWEVADLTLPPKEWLEDFDLVVEIHILQAIQIEVRIVAANILPRFLKPNGRLISIGRELTERVGEVSPPPWPLSRTWLMEQFSSLETILFKPIILKDWPDIDRYIGVWKQPKE